MESIKEISSQDLRNIAEQLATSIRETWAATVLRDRRPPNPHQHVYAGGWRACTRRMVYDMREPQNAMPFSADVLANFKRGSDRGRELVIDMTRIGRAADPPFEVFGQEERFVLKGRDGRVIMVGKTDMSLKQDRLIARAEIKNWNPNLTARITHFRDLFNNRWTRSGAYQLLAYLYGSNEPIGFMILDRPGLPKVLPVILHDYLDEMEEFLVRAEEACAHLDADTLPDYHNDPSECRACPFFAHCSPPLEHAGARVETDETILQLLEERATLEEGGKRFAKLDKQLKDYFRGVEIGLAGDFYIAGKWQALTTYVLTDEQKAQFKKTDPKGKFLLTFTKLTTPPKVDEGDD